MPKAVKYYSDEELDQKIKEMEALKEARAKERQELLDLAKIAFMDSWIESKKDDPEFVPAMNKWLKGMIEKMTSRKDKKTKKALEEFLKLFPIEPK